MKKRGSRLRNNVNSVNILVQEMAGFKTKNYLLFLIISVLLIAISGCSQEKAVSELSDSKDQDIISRIDNIEPEKAINEPAQQIKNGLQNNEATDSSQKPTPDSVIDAKPAQEEKKKNPGPSGCSSNEECLLYCSKNALDCKAWCDINPDDCADQGIAISMPSGIPGNPCATDSECMTGLCLGFKCDIPTPDNMAKKSGFSLPGQCKSMQECANYCAEPKNNLDCLKFCEQFPSFCNARQSMASEAPKECQACIDCNAKDCILDCTYKCYNYVSVKPLDVAKLKKDIVFERKYQSPIKAVWEPGPIYNLYGLTYFVDDYKDLGVNTYHVIPKYAHKDGELILTTDRAIGETAAKEIETKIIKAKKAGFQVVLVAHDLYDLFPDANPTKGEKINHADYIDDIESTALKWAAVAEEYKAEYFIPVNEFEYVLYENGYTAQQACEITNGIYKQITPKVREIYKGKIYCRVGGMDAKFECMDFTQCDIFGFTYGFTGSSYAYNFRQLYNTGEEVAKRDNKQYIMAEAFAFNKDGEEACFNLHRAGIQEYKNIAEHGIGYTFMGLIQRDPINKNDCPLIGTELVDEYKDFYTNTLK